MNTEELFQARTDYRRLILRFLEFRSYYLVFDDHGCSIYWPYLAMEWAAIVVCTAVAFYIASTIEIKPKPINSPPNEKEGKNKTSLSTGSLDKILFLIIILPSHPADQGCRLRRRTTTWRPRVHDQQLSLALHEPARGRVRW